MLRKLRKEISGSKGLGKIPTSRKQATVITDALLAKLHLWLQMHCLRKMKTTEFWNGGMMMNEILTGRDDRRCRHERDRQNRGKDG